MASTRNYNTYSDYCLHTDQVQRQQNWILDNTSRAHHLPAMPCAGVLLPAMPASVLSKNSVEVESYLYGISANNFINPVPTPVLETRKLPCVKFFDRTPLFIPKLPTAPADQRPFPV